MKEYKGIIILGIIVVGIYFFYNSYQKETWHGVYYPNGCLVCEDEYIFSPVFESKGECVAWGERKRNYRKNEQDTYECGKNCQWKDGFNVCKETVGMAGTGSSNTGLRF